jgi:hypothetical protein
VVLGAESVATTVDRKAIEAAMGESWLARFLKFGKPSRSFNWYARTLERVGRRVKAPTLPLPPRVRAPARESRPEIKDRGRRTRSSGGRSSG